MNIVLWILQILLAALFLLAGTLKLFMPLERLSGRMKWIPDFPPLVVRLIGLVEFLGGVGLILPSLTGILPGLTPLAALGLVLTMVAATGLHLRRNEGVSGSVIILVVSLVVFVGRFLIEPF